jgi:hypothetical protein
MKVARNKYKRGKRTAEPHPEKSVINAADNDDNHDH